MKLIDLRALKEITSITGGRLSRESVYNDFIELFALTISNRVDPVHYHERSARVAELQNLYTNDELDKMVHYQKVFTDILTRHHSRGRFPNIFAQLTFELGFFTPSEEPTPEDMAKLLSALTLGADEVPDNMDQAIAKKGFFTVSDPCVGTGALLISTAEEAHRKDINYCVQMVCCGVELKPSLLRQCYIQLSLYGIPAVIIHGNSITMEEFTRWYTPMYVIGDWVWRCPMGMTNGRSFSDELLKMHQEPIYGAMRQALAMFDKQNNTPDDETG